MSKLRRYGVELLLSVAIITILAWLAVRSYQIVLIKAEVVGTTMFPFGSAQRGSLIYLALHGEFPENTDQALASAVQESYVSYAEIDKRYNIVIEHGAVNITFKKSDTHLAGKTLTMRPVMQDDDPTGPVHWICGKDAGGKGWKIYGVDRTDVDDRYIPAALK